MRHYICMMFKAIYMAKELKKVDFVEEPFFIAQQMSRYFVVSFNFATQKLTRKTPKHSAYKLTCQNLRTLNINLHLGLHSVVHFHLAVKVTLITNSISNSEQSHKSFCHESRDSYYKFLEEAWWYFTSVAAYHLSLSRWTYYYSSQGNQAAIIVVQEFAFSSPEA